MERHFTFDIRFAGPVAYSVGPCFLVQMPFDIRQTVVFGVCR